MGQANTTKTRAITGDPRQVLQQKFALESFREGQHAVIERLLAGKNVAAVFPTGGGKSLCYQLPSQMLEGTTVVVSPLIALMKDQCDALRERGIQAVRLDSSISASEFSQAMTGIRSGAIKLLYASPERFFNERFLGTLESLNIDLFAIDEAHCISQWGHNFRPDYLKLADLTKRLAVSRVLALTATATPQVLSDICTAFEIKNDDAIRTKFYRPNLKLRSTVVDQSEAYESLLRHLKDRDPGPTLVYVTLQRTAEEVADQLKADGLDATAYHAGMESERRVAIQQAFIESARGIVVATIAFGMGIDKPNIRYVYHFNPPKSLESYAQEIGRAGRDGNDAICEMILEPSDRIVLENFVYGDTPSRQNLGRLIEILSGQPDQFFVSHYKLSFETDIRQLVVRTLITYMEIEGMIESVSPRYDSYKIKPLVSSKSILDQFQGERREFIGSVLAHLTKARKFFSLNVTLTAKKLDVDRSRVVKALEYLSERQWIELQVSDLVHGYRWIRRIDSKKTFADQLYDRLMQREQSELGRIDEVFELAQASNCLAKDLSQHFGESLDQPCGNCTHCIGEGQQTLDWNPVSAIGSAARRTIDQVASEYPDRFTTRRDKARFLCGLTSPGFSRARLTRHESFGICQHIPFDRVIEQV